MGSTELKIFFGIQLDIRLALKALSGMIPVYADCKEKEVCRTVGCTSFFIACYSAMLPIIVILHFLLEYDGLFIPEGQRLYVYMFLFH